MRILIVDNHKIFRKGLLAILETEEEFEVVGEAWNGIQAVEQAALLEPDVILMDIVMPEMDGLTATREIKKKNPKARVLILTSFVDTEKIIMALQAGALGYVLKDSLPSHLICAVRSAYKGKATLSSHLAQKLMLSVRAMFDEIFFSHCELETMRYMANGWSSVEIASLLEVEEGMVGSYLASFIQKIRLLEVVSIHVNEYAN